VLVDRSIPGCGRFFKGTCMTDELGKEWFTAEAARIYPGPMFSRISHSTTITSRQTPSS